MEEKAPSLSDFLAQFRKTPAEPSYEYIDLPDTERLTFELVTEDNYTTIHQLFANDSNPFVINDYKDSNELEKYIDCQLNYNRYSRKYGACDWLIQLKETKQYIGILNLYSLSQETFNDIHKRCMIGFSMSEAFRRKYYTLEAVRQLIDHANQHYGRNKIVANTEKDNRASQSFLRKMGFEERTEDYYYKDKYDYFVLLLNE
jgi:RimJ/RimL family protein N-acetyltransferase